MSEQNEVREVTPDTDTEAEVPVEEYYSKMTVQLGPILEAETKHGPIFRRELFDAAYAAYNSLSRDPADREVLKDERGGTRRCEEVTLMDIHGKEHKVRVLDQGFRVEYDGQQYTRERVWLYNSIQRLGYMNSEYEEVGLYPYGFGTRDIEADAQDCFQESDITAKTQAWTEQWEKSELCRRLTAHLEEHAGKTMQHVDKIICFGLGCFTTEWERSCRRSYIQHLAACTIRDLLARHQGGEAPRIYAQEPDYCAAGKSLLTTHFNMTVLDDPEGFKALDGHSFVLSISPNVPVRQIALGLTHEHGGPAGFLCNDIRSDGLECNGKSCVKEDGRWMAPYKTCEPSPALWKYKQESVWTEYGDKLEEDSFGNVGLYLKRKSE